MTTTHLPSVPEVETGDNKLNGSEFLGTSQNLLREKMNALDATLQEGGIRTVVREGIVKLVEGDLTSAQQSIVISLLQSFPPLQRLDLDKSPSLTLYDAALTATAIFLVRNDLRLAAEVSKITAEKMSMGYALEETIRFPKEYQELIEQMWIGTETGMGGILKPIIADLVDGKQIKLGEQDLLAGLVALPLWILSSEAKKESFWSRLFIKVAPTAPSEEVEALVKIMGLGQQLDPKDFEFLAALSKSGGANRKASGESVFTAAVDGLVNSSTSKQASLEAFNKLLLSSNTPLSPDEVIHALRKLPTDVNWGSKNGGFKDMEKALKDSGNHCLADDAFGSCENYCVYRILLRLESFSDKDKLSTIQSRISYNLHKSFQWWQNNEPYRISLEAFLLDLATKKFVGE